jgi:hypothetical protein
MSVMMMLIWLPNLFDLTTGVSPDKDEWTNLTAQNPFGQVSTLEAFNALQCDENKKRKE